jgi:hypothetical protein
MRQGIIFIFLFLIMLTGCSEKPPQVKIQDSMAELDQVYIPTFIFTDLGRQRESEIAFERFKNKWDAFYDKYYGLEIKYGVNITDKFWKEDFDRINGAVITAEALIREGDLFDANDELITVRVTLRKLRHRNNISYFLDRLAEFDDLMDQMVRSLRGKDRLTERDVDNLRGLFRQAQASWLRLENSEMELELFGFEAEKEQAVRDRIREEARMLGVFAAALSSRDTDKMFQAIQDLKPNFVVLYKAFGDFQPVFDQVVKERKEREKKAKENGSTAEASSANHIFGNGGKKK